MKLEFLVCGSATPAFFSQIAFFKLCLNALGEDYADARVVAVFGDHHEEVLPERWRREFDGIDVEWSHSPDFPIPNIANQHEMRVDLIGPDADIAVLCDADIAPMRRFDDLSQDILSRPALAGVIAHYHFTMAGRERRPDVDWREVARAVIGKHIQRPYRYTLLDKTAQDEAPFYINYGVYIGTPELMKKVHRRDRQISDNVGELGLEFFKYQVSLALACHDLGVPTMSLPMRYNFPNDPKADALYPDELKDVVFFHYLRRNQFQRELIFSDPASFEKFIVADLQGSNRVFQDFVKRITGDTFPFS